MTPEDMIKEVGTQIGSAVAALRKEVDATIGTQVKSHSDASAKALNEKIDKIQTHLDTLETKKAELEKAILENQRMAKLITKSGEAKPEDHEEVHKAFVNFIRTGDCEGGRNMTLDKKEFRYEKALQRKSMSVISDADGGYMVQNDFNGRVVRKVFETSPVRQVATVVTVGSDAQEGLTDYNEADGGWVGETESRPETNTPQIGKWLIPVHELYAFPKQTQKFLDDAPNAEAWLAAKVADKLARLEATAFVSGNGVKKPRGFLTYPAGTTLGSQIEQIVSGSASTITPDALFTIQDSLKMPYRARGQWAMNRGTRRVIRQLKDSQNRYLWEPSLQAGTPSSLLGDPILEFNDMPAIAGAALPLAYADWSEFYTILERLGLRILRDPYTVKGYVGFYTTRRVGGDVSNFEAGKIMVIST
jgi:HK97 family phage major capsid protein